MLKNTPKPVLVSTIPRSGTFWCHYFFHFFNLALSGKEFELDGVTDYPKSIGGVLMADPFIVAHAWCPGHKECVGSLPDDWNALEAGVGHDYGANMMRETNVEFSPAKNRDARIVLVYRNPLDQALSHYLQTQHHEGLGNFSSPEDFFFQTKALEKYLKQFLTFFAVAQANPGNVLFVKYEELTRDPAKVFLRMIGHMRTPIVTPHPALARYIGEKQTLCFQTEKRDMLLRMREIFRIDDPGLRAMVRNIVAATMPDAMRNIEEKLGHALTGEHVREGFSHLNTGTPGLWKRHFPDKTHDWTMERLKAFGLKASDFDFG